jgi:hypothetical protein
MNGNEKKYLRELLLLNKKLRMLYNNDDYFIKLYENRNDDIEDEFIIISVGNKKNIFSDVSKEVINYMITNGQINMDIFDSETKKIHISDYWSLVEAIKYLIFDLSKSYTDNDKPKLNNS